jgi:hypothetical protein
MGVILEGGGRNFRRWALLEDGGQLRLWPQRDYGAPITLWLPVLKYNFFFPFTYPHHYKTQPRGASSVLN